ncbi:protein insensitive [Drosophila tropicalis]|uniref:protein insensitive n=1 Tax=Drosophila tropicalis TaxID=46794 RepID=UPI0035AC1118
MDMQSYKRERVIAANGSNFVSTEQNHGRPMLLNAWTQTDAEDFKMLKCLNEDTSIEAENRALLEKVRYLEAKLQQHSDLLTQIHATSARIQATTMTKDPPSPPSQQQHQILTPPNSVICAPIQPLQPRHTQVVDYKIITAEDDTDAIEIRLAAESLNSLSTSADSDRLEICLGEEQQQHHHHQQPQQQQKPQEQHKLQPVQPQILNVKRDRDSIVKNDSSPLQFIKRRKLQELNDTNSLNASSQSKDNVMVSIGPNNTLVPASIFENINWSASSLATRKLLVTIFDRETLATHSMTGKPSPAFKDQHKPLKQMLDPLKIADIIFAVTHKCSASEKEVRNAITTKCADENKMMKIQKGKRLSLQNVDGDKENFSIS